MGRPKRLLSPCAEAGWFAGVEFNAERIQAVRVDFVGKLIASEMRSLGEGSATKVILVEVKSAITALRKQAKSPPLGIGIGAPGVVDPRRRIGLHCAFVSDWLDVPVAKIFSRAFNVGVALENNLRMIAIAERWFGAGRDLEDYIVLGPRSGFGIAIVHGGRLYEGSNHAAGEIGQWPWQSVGQRMELHDVLSASAVWRSLSGSSARSRLPARLHAALGKYANTTSPERDSVVRDFAQILGSLHLLLDACFDQVIEAIHRFTGGPRDTAQE